MRKALWNFALELYAQPGIEATCLALQDRHGEDICLLICGAWLDQRGLAYTPSRRDALRALAGEWQRLVIAPLRELRRCWKPAAAADDAVATLRQRLAQLELDAERELLARLEGLCTTWPLAQPGVPPQWLSALAQSSTDTVALARLVAAAGQ